MTTDLAVITDFVDGLARLPPSPPLLHHLNLLRLLGLGSDEVADSRVLAWLLDLHQEHGVGSLFLQNLANACALELEGEWAADYRVAREFRYADSTVDVVVYGLGRFAIFIENKIGAPVDPEQLARELCDLRAFGAEKGVPEAQQRAVVVLPSGRLPSGVAPMAVHVHLPG